MTPLGKLLEFASCQGLHVTSTTGGSHNPGSLHYQHRAIDVRSRTLSEAQVAHVKDQAERWGILVRDERKRPPGQKVWGGPHLHLEIPLQ